MLHFKQADLGNNTRFCDLRYLCTYTEYTEGDRARYGMTESLGRSARSDVPLKFSSGRFFSYEASRCIDYVYPAQSFIWRHIHYGLNLILDTAK